MSDDAPRTMETCAECGTPLEVADVNEHADERDGTALVLRCANGHQQRVTRHHDDGLTSGRA